MVDRSDDLARQEEGHPGTQTVGHLSYRGGRHSLRGTEPEAGDGQGSAAHHDVGEAVEDGADVTGDSEGGVVGVRQVHGDTPDDSASGHESGGDEHGEPEGVAQEPHHGYKAQDVEDGAVVGEEGHGLVSPAVHQDRRVVYRSPGVPYCVLTE